MMPFLDGKEYKLIALCLDYTGITGVVVGHQAFGGARGSGTNDKAGSFLNRLRWTSARTIKENFVPPDEYAYPFMVP